MFVRIRFLYQPMHIVLNPKHAKQQKLCKYKLTSSIWKKEFLRKIYLLKEDNPISGNADDADE